MARAATESRREKGRVSGARYVSCEPIRVGIGSADLLQQVRWRDGVECPRCRSGLTVRNGSYPIVRLFGGQIERLTTSQQRQQRRVQQNFDDMLLRRIELIQFVPRLQFPEK